MGKVIAGLTMSLDGYVTDRDGGIGALYPDLAALDNSAYLRESIAATGAALMGRNTYDMARDAPDGFEGYEFQVPIFVLTHRPPERVYKGENDRLRFHFVTDGPAAAVALARRAAGARDVQVIGGAATVRQVLEARLCDELELLVAPVLLGGGTRLFDGMTTAPGSLDLLGVREVRELGLTVLRYRIRSS
jgi:dihydrofolate reductase